MNESIAAILAEGGTMGLIDKRADVRRRPGHPLHVAGKRAPLHGAARKSR